MDTTNAAGSERRPLLADLLGDTSQTWQTLVGTAADQAIADDWCEAFAPLNAIVGQLGGTDRSLALSIDGAVGHLASTLTRRAALVGYALARTWPASPEELDGWAARARTFVGE